jgi:hypothetical protein
MKRKEIEYHNCLEYLINCNNNLVKEVEELKTTAKVIPPLNKRQTK